MTYDIEGQLSFFDDVPTKSKREELMDKVLTYGSGFAGGKKRIHNELSKDIPLNDKAKFLREEYGIGGVGPIFGDYNMDHDARGISLSNREREEHYGMDYTEAARRITRMIQDGTYTYEEEEEDI